MSDEKKADNQLQVIVKDSGLETTKAKIILDKFQDYFQIAAEWEVKARAIVVTDATQIFEMQTAKVGRLLLREKRIAIEKTRKELKEQALREGKAIDGIANVLKALIVPIEEHLAKQEKFVEIQMAEEAERQRVEAERKAEEERIAQEKAEREEQERIRVENIRLKKEAEKRERAMVAERKRAAEKMLVEIEKARVAQDIADEKARVEREKAQAELEAAELKARTEREKVQAEHEAAEVVRRAAEAKAQKEHEVAWAKARVEKEAAEKKARDEREVAKVKAMEERRQALVLAEKRDRAAAAEREKARVEVEKMQAKLAEEKERKAREIKCPYCHKTFTPEVKA